MAPTRRCQGVGVTASGADAPNRVLETEAPAVFASLSPLGRRIYYPRDITFQAAQARGVAFNGTIGQMTDGSGGAMRLSPIDHGLGGLSAEDRNDALLYSPMAGLPEVRQRWRAWQRREQPDSKASSLPVVTVGITHGIGIAADLFGGPDKAIAVPAPFWGNYRHLFATRGGARIVNAPSIRDGRFQPEVIAEALADEPPGAPAVAVVNFPANPGGYMPTTSERAALVASLVSIAAERPLVVLCDDAYEGLVYEEAVPRASVFWDLVGAHANLTPVKVDGATKEFAFFGGRIGFLTFGLVPDSPAAAALEDKVLGLVRSSVGSPVSASQVLLLQALRNAEVAAEIEAIRVRLERRYIVLKSAMANVDPALLRPLPFNAGCFALVELPEGVEPDAVRRHLIESEDTGVIAVAPRYLRLAFCSLSRAAIPELVRRTERGVAALAGARVGAAGG